MWNKHTFSSVILTRQFHSEELYYSWPGIFARRISANDRRLFIAGHL